MTQSARKPYPALFSYVGYLIFSLLLAGAGLEIGSALVRVSYRWIHPAKDPPSSASPAYLGYAWAQEYWKEEHLRWSATDSTGYIPFLVWGETPWHSKYINVDENAFGAVRRTTNPPCERTQRAIIWMFGGSTVFGLGVPDEATLPFYLSQDLNSKGTACFAISNFGVEGYVTNQELILLMELLKQAQRPDLVIFYDGVNDSSAAVSPGIPGAHLEFGTVKARVEGSLSSKLDFLRESNTFHMARAVAVRLGRGDLVSLRPSEISARAAAALDNYEANINAVRVLGQAYKFKVYCFWQPSLAFGGKPLEPFEQQLWDINPGAYPAARHKILMAVNEEAARRSAQNAGFVFLGHVFDSVKAPIYIDNHMHIGPLGNQIVADAIAKWIQAHPEN